MTILECDLLIAMKLLLSEVKALMGRYDEALEQLYILRELLTKHSTGISIFNTMIAVTIVSLDGYIFWVACLYISHILPNR